MKKLSVAFLFLLVLTTSCGLLEEENPKENEIVWMNQSRAEEIINNAEAFPYTSPQDFKDEELVSAFKKFSELAIQSNLFSEEAFGFYRIGLLGNLVENDLQWGVFNRAEKFLNSHEISGYYDWQDESGDFIKSGNTQEYGYFSFENDGISYTIQSSIYWELDARQFGHDVHYNIYQSDDRSRGGSIYHYHSFERNPDGDFKFNLEMKKLIFSEGSIEEEERVDRGKSQRLGTKKTNLTWTDEYGNTENLTFRPSFSYRHNEDGIKTGSMGFKFLDKGKLVYVARLKGTYDENLNISKLELIIDDVFDPERFKKRIGMVVLEEVPYIELENGEAVSNQFVNDLVGMWEDFSVN